MKNLLKVEFQQPQIYKIWGPSNLSFNNPILTSKQDLVSLTPFWALNSPKLRFGKLNLVRKQDLTGDCGCML